MSGKFNEDLYNRSYGFIRDYQESEIETLRKDITKEKNEEKKYQLQNILSRMQSRLNAQKLKEHRESIKRSVKKKELELVKEGKKPFFLKKCNL
jgi:ribosomal RNA-processing protein 36